jgi:hypothetical protein
VIQFHVNDVVVEYGINLGGEDRKGLGGIFNAPIGPSNISNTLLMDGLSAGFVWMHHKPTIIIFLKLVLKLAPH